MGVATATAGIPAASEITARLDRLPIGPFHWRLLGLIGAGMFFDATRPGSWIPGLD